MKRTRRGKKTKCGPKLELGPLFILFKDSLKGCFRFKSMLCDNYFFFFFLQMAYKLTYTLNLNAPCSYSYLGMDIICYLDIEFSNFFTPFENYMTISPKFQIQGSNTILNITKFDISKILQVIFEMIFDKDIQIFWISTQHWLLPIIYSLLNLYI
jgi:hypothetical protein